MYLVTVQIILKKELVQAYLYKNTCLRTNNIEANIEEDIDLKNRFRIRNLPDPISIREAASKNYADNKFNGPNITKNTAHVDFDDRQCSHYQSKLIPLT